MKVLAFLGSPRKGGNSEVLLGAVLRGVERGGSKTEIVRLCDLSIDPCLNCGGCDDTGECILDDDMTLLYDKIIAVPRIILASPIFFYGITAQAKAFIDRTQALWNRKRLLKDKGLWQKSAERRGFFVSVAATKGAKVFEGAILTMKYGYDAMDIKYSGEFLVRGVEGMGKMARLTDTLREAEEAGEKFIQNRS